MCVVLLECAVENDGGVKMANKYSSHMNKQNKTQKVELQMIKKPTRCAKSRKSFGHVCRQDFQIVWEAFINGVKG